MNNNSQRSPYAVDPELLAQIDNDFDEFHAALSEKSVSSSSKKIGLYRWFRRIVVSFGVLFTGLVSTYILFPRLSVIYFTKQFGAYSSILLSAGSVLVLLFALYLLISIIIARKIIWNKYVQIGLTALVLSYMAYGLLFLNNANIKEPTIKETYLNLHPILRIGLTTAILADTKLIITNTQRTKGDYKKWGITPREKSLHYIQKETGFVHAVDIRTKGRSNIQNKIVEIGFKLMGFKTLRHIGTADHIHVSLPTNGN